MKREKNVWEKLFLTLQNPKKEFLFWNVFFFALRPLNWVGWKETPPVFQPKDVLIWTFFLSRVHSFSVSLSFCQYPYFFQSIYFSLSTFLLLLPFLFILYWAECHLFSLFLRAVTCLPLECMSITFVCFCLACVRLQINLSSFCSSFGLSLFPVFLSVCLFVQLSTIIRPNVHPSLTDTLHHSTQTKLRFHLIHSHFSFTVFIRIHFHSKTFV